MDKEIINKIRQAKCMEGKTIEDVVNSDAFARNLSAYIKAQVDDRKAVLAYAVAVRKKGLTMKAPSHVIDDFLAKGFADVDVFREEFLRVAGKISNEPVRLREYIRQLGMQVYAVTVVDMVSEEFPELKNELLNIKENGNESKTNQE